MERLTKQEEELMLLLWQRGPSFIKDLLTDYADPKPPYTTLASVAKNLERKKYVRNEHIKNTYRYIPIIEQDEYKRTFMNNVVSNYFDNSYKDVVSFFAREQKLSPDDLQDIIDMINKGREEDQS